MARTNTKGLGMPSPMTPEDVRLLVQALVAQGLGGLEQRIEGMLTSLPKPGELPPIALKGSGITAVAGRSIMPLMVRWRQVDTVTKYDINLGTGKTVMFQNGVRILVDEDAGQLTQLGITPWYNLVTCDGSDTVTDLYAVAIPDLGGTSGPGWQVNPDAYVKVRFYTNLTIAGLTARQQGGFAYGLQLHLAKIIDRSIVWQAFDGEKNGAACMGDGDRNGYGGTQNADYSSIAQVALGQHQIVNFGMEPANNDPTVPMVVGEMSGSVRVTKLMAQPSGSSDAPPSDPSTNVDTMRHDDPLVEGTWDANHGGDGSVAGTATWTALGAGHKGLLVYIPFGPPIYKADGDHTIYQYCRAVKITNNGRVYNASAEGTRITVVECIPL